jgi:hypothetical protein
MLVPGLNSVIVPPPVVVVVVVVLSDTCAQAKGAAIANAILNTTFFMFVSLHFASVRLRGFSHAPSRVLAAGCVMAKQHPVYGNVGFNQ